MSKWTHAVCRQCWSERNPGREPVRVSEAYLDEKAEPCCFCGRPQQSGIFVRAAPDQVMCKGLCGNGLMEVRGE